MYPAEELIALGRRKAALRVRSAASRKRYAEGAAGLARLVARWVDGAAAYWKRAAPWMSFAVVALRVARILKNARR